MFKFLLTGSNIFILVICMLLLSLIINRLAIFLSHRNELFIDQEDKPQKIHLDPTPRLGSVAVFIAYFLGSIFVYDHIALALVMLPTYLGGLLEDKTRKVSPKTRLLLMILTAIGAVYFLDATVTNFDFFHVPTWLGVIITLVAIVGLTNGINFIDGFNGLAGITNLLMFTNLFLLASFLGDQEYAGIFMTIIGALLGFLIFNLPQGKIFFGDGGAYLLGGLAAISSILLFNKYQGEISPWYFLMVVIYPVWEVIFSFFRRIIKSRNPLQPDNLHLHTLIYRNLAFNKNSLVVLFLAPTLAIFQGLTFYYRQDSVMLLALSLAFVSIYYVSYRFLRKLDYNRNKELSKLEHIYLEQRSKKSSLVKA